MMHGPGLIDTPRRFALNVGWVSWAKVLSAALTLPFMIILAQRLGKEGWGLFSMTISILTFIRVIGGGIGQSTGKRIAALPADDKGETGRFLAAGLLFQVLTALLLASIIWLFAPTIAGLFKNTSGLAVALKTGAVIFIFFSLCEFSKASLQGAQRFDYVALITVIEYGGKLLFCVAFIFAGQGVVGALNGFALGLVVAFIAAFILFMRLGLRLPSISRAEWLSLINYSLPLTMTAMGFVVYAELDNLMIGHYMDEAAVGVYAVAIFIARGIPEMAKPIGQAAAPLIVKLRQSNKAQASEFTHRLLKYVVAVFSPISMALLVLAPQILTLVSPQYVEGAAALRTMSIFVLSLSLMSVVQPMLDYMGQAWRRAGWLMGSVCANVLLNFLLIPYFGGLGAALATAVTYTPYALSNVVMVARMVGLEIKQVVVSTGKIFLASAGAGAAARLLYFWSDNLAGSLIGAAPVYVALLLLTGIFSLKEMGEVLDNIVVGMKAPASGEQRP